MTAVELARIVRDVVPPRGATSAVCVVDHEIGERLKDGQLSGKGGRTTYRAGFWVDGLRKVAVGPAFDRPRDAIRLVDALNGEAPRREPQPDLARVRISTASRDEVAAPAEAPVLGAGASLPTCVICGRDLPPGSRPQRRTDTERCRRALARRDAAERRAAALTGAPGDVPLSGGSEAVTSDPSSRAGRDTLRGQLEATDPTDFSDGSTGAPPSLGL